MICCLTLMITVYCFCKLFSFKAFGPGPPTQVVNNPKRNILRTQQQHWQRRFTVLPFRTNSVVLCSTNAWEASQASSRDSAQSWRRCSTAAMASIVQTLTSTKSVWRGGVKKGAFHLLVSASTSQTKRSGYWAESTLWPAAGENSASSSS